MTVTVAGLAFALLPLAAQAASVSLKIAHVAPPTSSFQINSERFAKHLRQVSGGTMDVEIVPGGALGNLVQLWAQLRAGSLDMHVIDIGAILPMKEARHFFIVTMPYLFRDQAHWRSFLAGDVFAGMMAKAETATGIKYVGPLGDRPPRALTTRKKKVMTPADMKGMKIRTPLNPAITEVFKAWGAAPTPVKGSELYQSLQSGLVNGQENGIDAVVQAGLTEVQKYFMNTRYIHSGIGMWISGAKWQSLSAEQQGWVTAAAKAANDEAVAAFDGEVAAMFAQAKAKGMEIVEPDIAAFRAAARPIVEAWDGKRWPKGMYDKIHAMK
jgi:TRAP-type C4-dicarboxylate transport system substrate-binding protein